jgi:hypothetical protein
MANSLFPLLNNHTTSNKQHSPAGLQSLVSYSKSCLTFFAAVPAGIGLVLNHLPSLQDLDGFSRLTRVPGDLQLYLLGALPHLRGLAALQEVGLNAVVGAN